jgi:putative sterol carrier protein
VDEYYEYRIGDDIFHAHVCDGELQTWEGPAPDPAFTLTTDASTYRDMLAGTVLLREAVARGAASVTGSTDALIRSGRVFDMTGLRRNRPA